MSTDDELRPDWADDFEAQLNAPVVAMEAELVAVARERDQLRERVAELEASNDDELGERDRLHSRVQHLETAEAGYQATILELSELLEAERDEARAEVARLKRPTAVREMAGRLLVIVRTPQRWEARYWTSGHVEGWAEHSFTAHDGDCWPNNGVRWSVGDDCFSEHTWPHALIGMLGSLTSLGFILDTRGTQAHVLDDLPSPVRAAMGLPVEVPNE